MLLKSVGVLDTAILQSYGSVCEAFNLAAVSDYNYCSAVEVELGEIVEDCFAIFGVEVAGGFVG